MDPFRDLAADRSAAAYSPRPLTEGELWTAAALHELQAAQFRPRAWARFINRAYDRATDTRLGRPELASQARQWGLIGAGAWLAACRGAKRVGWESPPVAAGLIWWTAVYKMLDWHLGMAECGDGVPRKQLSPADGVTLVRFWVVPLVGGAAGSQYGLPVLIALGGASDWLDGTLARRYGRTRLGRDLDTTADLAFLSATAWAVSASGKLPPVAVRALATRYAVGASLSFGAVFGRARRPAIRARPIGGVLRFGGLVMATAGCRRTGTAILIGGCLVPPISTARELSPA